MDQGYTPTIEQMEGIKPKPDRLKVSGDGAFATLQGEGVTAGLPAVFLRLHYCNLTCGQPDGWMCDTWYTWDKTRPEYWLESEDWSYEEATEKIVSAWDKKFPDNQEKRLVVTGGEPLLQQRKIAKLLEMLPDWDVEIETNGTIAPIAELIHCQFNCSPKLSNSGNTLTKRYRPKVLMMLNELPRTQFKFVVVNPDDLNEIEEIVTSCNLNPEKVLIMPEGSTKEEVDAHLRDISDALAVKKWGVTLRNQLIWYGPKRRT
jgi:organic radical activating enzyme